MGEPSLSEIQAEAVRVQRALEHVLDRHAGSGESERSAALARALGAELSKLAAPSQALVLSALAALYPEELAATAPAPGDRAAASRLEQEVADLKGALQRAKVQGAAPRSTTPLPTDLVAALVQAVAGGRGAASITTPDGQQRLVAITMSLVSFASGLARTYLGVTAEPDKTMAGHLQAVLADELEGRRPAGSADALLEQIRRQIGGQLVAFREACESGARNLLKQIAPSAIADGTQRKAKVSIGGVRPFYYRECWEAFEAQWEELKAADNIYETYFDGGFRGALLRARSHETGPKPRNGGSRP